MTINKTVNFSIKTLDGNESAESASLKFNVPEYYNSKTLVDKTNYLLYRAFQTQLNNERQGTRSTKTRAEVKGGGRKPWKQKGTGRARAGSNRSPLWKGGGVSFGPRPKIYSNKINKKEWRLSLRLLLLKKAKDIIVVENFNITSLKTKDLVKTIKNLGPCLSTKTIIVVPRIEKILQQASRNLKNIKILQANSLNFKDLLLTKSIVLTKDSLKIIEETYKNV